MGLLSRLFSREVKSASIIEAVRNYISLGETSLGGQSVTHDTALQVTTVLACVRVLANGVAQVPWKVYRPTKDGRGSNPAPDHPLYWVLYRQPNEWQTSFQFRRTLVMHRTLAGNAYAFINRVGGEIKELIPLEPGRVDVERRADLSLVYWYTGLDGLRQAIPADAIWHLPDLSWNSWKGLPAVKLTREAIGLAMSAERSQVRVQQTGGRVNGLFSVESTLTDDQYKMLRGWLDKQISAQIAAEAAGGFLLDRKASFSPMQMTSADAQTMETRRWQVEEICRGLGVMPIMVGYAEGNTSYASSEQMFLAHVVHALAPWYEDIEQSADVKLIAERGAAFCKFSQNGLLRGAIADRFEAYAKALGAGGSPAWMTPNDVRALEDMNPHPSPEADQLPRPTNTTAAQPAPKEPA